VRTVTKYLSILSVFAAVTAAVYWLVTYEAVGAVLLVGFCLMPLIVMLFGIRHGALRDARNEDDPGADPSRSAGETLGPFPNTTVWPIFLVLGLITVGASLIYGVILIAPGAVLMVWSIVGLTRESRG